MVEMKYKSIIQLARDLRKNQTKSERILWEILRNRKFHNIKFLRQHPIIYDSDVNKSLFIIVDFYCAEYKFILEVDGKIHDYQKEHDENRDLIVKSLGLKVLRIKNEELENIEDVKLKILEVLRINF